MGSQLRVRLADELHYLLHCPGRGVAAAKPWGISSPEVPLGTWGEQGESNRYPGPRGSAPAAPHPVAADWLHSQSTGRDSTKGGARPCASDSCSTRALVHLLMPHSSGQPSVLSPFPQSTAQFPPASPQLGLPPCSPSSLPTFAENNPPASLLSPVLPSLTTCTRLTRQSCSTFPVLRVCWAEPLGEILPA